jgi:hypothetical protein
LRLYVRGVIEGSDSYTVHHSLNQPFKPTQEKATRKTKLGSVGFQRVHKKAGPVERAME